MLDVLRELARQVPSAVAVIVTVFLFIRYLMLSEQRRETSDASREARADRAEAARLDATRQVGESCHAFQREMATRVEVHHGRMTEALDRNTAAMARNTLALEREESRGKTKHVGA